MSQTNPKLILPTPSQQQWADAELGVIIHLDVQVFEPTFEFRKSWSNVPDAKIFNPRELDTDQWIQTAAKAGAKYAVLAAKHCSGFSLWPTKAHHYSIAASPWKNGKGDIVGDFFASCKKFGIKPGLYCSLSCNGLMNVDNPGKVRGGDALAQQRYNEMATLQMTELWTNYGKVFEIWFDGGVLPPEQGGPDVVNLIKRLQPEAVVYCGTPQCNNLVRGSGNELGYAVLPNWSVTRSSEDITAVGDKYAGDPHGDIWAPAECDLPNRKADYAFQGGWFWREGDDAFLYSPDEMLEAYCNSVGQNSNLLFGMVIDNRGLVPEADRKVFEEFGKQLHTVFSRKIAATAGQGKTITLDLPSNESANLLVLQEDIAQGERIRQFHVEALQNGQWIKIWNGTAMGHKRIERFNKLSNTTALRLTITQSVGEPCIRQFSAWQIDEKLFKSPMCLSQRSSLAIGRDKNGFVSIRCSNPTLSIRYTTDGSQPDQHSKLFEKPFAMRDGGSVKAFAFVNEQNPSRTFTTIFGCDRSDWRVVSTSLDSPYDNGGAANVNHLLDDNPDTYWHTYHGEKSKSSVPQEVVLDMGRERSVEAFTFMPRIHDPSGTPTQCEFLLSDDGQHWTLAARAAFPDIETNIQMQHVKLPKTMRGRFLRFVARQVIHDVHFVAVAGIGIVESKS